MLLKNRLLTRFEPLIFTVLSDDDTILLIATSEETAEKIYSDLSPNCKMKLATSGKKFSH
jgi:transcriptional regulator of arginine metabolism